MANLPEQPNFDEGVYQLELTDPVVGGPNGISNRPIRNLANRTQWLRDQIAALVRDKADRNSPALTGTPTAPAPTDSDNSTRIATTGWVRRVIGVLAAPLSHVGARGNAHGEATTSEAGFMSAADKTKLNGIASGAQPNAVTSVAGKTGAVTLTVSDVSGVAPTNNATFTGTTTIRGTAVFDQSGDARGRTWPPTDNSISFATTAWVRSAMSDIAQKAGFKVETRNSVTPGTATPDRAVGTTRGECGIIALPSFLGGLKFVWANCHVMRNTGWREVMWHTPISEVFTGGATAFGATGSAATIHPGGAWARIALSEHNASIEEVRVYAWAIGR